MAISTALTYRRISGTRWQPLIGIRQSDFEEAGRATGMLPDGGTFDQPFFAPKPGVVLPTGNGREDINREGYHQRFWGLEVNARKRLSENWMMRLGFSSNSHVEFFTDPSQAIEDPTPMVFDPQLGGQRWHSPQRNGGSVIKVTEGSGKRDIFLAVPKYQFVANGMYQAPGGVSVGMSLISRQGFPQPFYAQTRGVPDPAMPTKKVVVVDDVGANRLPAVTTLDFRIAKSFTVDQTNFIITADVFNVGNASTVLRRQYDVTTTGSTGSGSTLEIMNPRVLRFGLRVTF